MEQKDQAENFLDEIPLPSFFDFCNASEDEGTTREATGQEPIAFMNGSPDFGTARLDTSDGQYAMYQSSPAGPFLGAYIEELDGFSTVPSTHGAPATIPISANFETHSRDAQNDFISDAPNQPSFLWGYPQLFSSLPVSNSSLDINPPSTQVSQTSMSSLGIIPELQPELQTATSSGTSSRRQSTENSAGDANSLSPSIKSASCLKGESPPSSCSTYPGDSSSWSPGSGGSFANFPISPTTPPKRKRRDTTDGQKCKKNKLRREGVCIGCRLRRNACDSDRNGLACMACVKSSQRFPRCISTKPNLMEKNVFLHSLGSDLRNQVLRLASSNARPDDAIQVLCGRLVDFSPALEELQLHKLPRPDGCKPVRQQSYLRTVTQGWFGKLYLSNLLVSAHGVLRASRHFKHTDEDTSNFVAIRAVSAAKAFRYLDFAIEKNRLEKMVDPSRKRIRELVVFLAITLEQVLSFEPGQKGDQFCDPPEDNLQGQPPWSEVTACNSLSKNELEKMRTSLAYHLAYFLRFLIEKVFDKDHLTRSGIAESIDITKKSITLEDTFWEKFIQLSTTLDKELAHARNCRKKQTATSSSVGGNQRKIFSSQVIPYMVVTRPTFEVSQGCEPYTPISDESYETQSDENDDAKSIASLRSESVELTDDEIKSISASSENDHVERVHSLAAIGLGEVQHGEDRNTTSRYLKRGFVKIARGVKNLFTA